MRSKSLTIFEGPDGGGKSTLARDYAERTGARYVHCGVYPNVRSGLARLYVDAIMPAVLGFQDVVLDRCWLSEKPYGDAFRAGSNRLTVGDVRMLERLALRCALRYVLCLPPKDSVTKTFLSRKGEEYLVKVDQLHQVYHAYEAMEVTLPKAFCTVYDYTSDNADLAISRMFQSAGRSTPHRLSSLSAGNLDSRIAIVGENFGQIKNDDPLYQWPFASFSGSGCSQWLTAQLAAGGIPEDALYWINSDQISPDDPDVFVNKTIIALGSVAASNLKKFGVEPHFVQLHPQAWKRFHSSEPYYLIECLKGLI